jgi:hypothetical protein
VLLLESITLLVDTIGVINQASFFLTATRHTLQVGIHDDKSSDCDKHDPLGKTVQLQSNNPQSFHFATTNYTRRSKICMNFFPSSDIQVRYQTIKNYSEYISARNLAKTFQLLHTHITQEKKAKGLYNTTYATWDSNYYSKTHALQLYT